MQDEPAIFYYARKQRNYQRLMNWEWCHQNDKHKLFLTSLSFTRRTINNYLRIRHHWKNSRIWWWSWSTNSTTEIKTDWIRRVREAGSSMLTSFPLPRSSTAPCREISPDPSWGKESPEGQPAPSPASWVTLLKPLLWSCITGISGQSVGLNY